MDNGHPNYDSEEVIQRLINENSSQSRILNEIKLILNSYGEFDGLTIVGGIKTILRRYIEEKNKVLELSSKIHKLK